ncbi:hypothetical protein VTI74DRAFT_5600 [Chaetomium olivicolor]
MKIELTSRSDGCGDSYGDGDGDGDGQGAKISGTTIEEVYDSYADSYEVGSEETRFPHHGFTLDLGCGTGAVGMLIRQSALNSTLVNNNVNLDEASHQPKVYIHGIDISTGMIKTPWCVHHYNSTQHGLVQDVLMDPNAAWVQHAVVNGGAKNPSLADPIVDHITCFGVLYFLKPTEFEAVLSRMFRLARPSIMFDIDDVCPMYVDHLLEKHGEGFRNYNHIAAYRKFGTPLGWAKVVEEDTVICHSLNVGVDVKGILARFERVNCSATGIYTEEDQQGLGIINWLRF